MMFTFNLDDQEKIKAFLDKVDALEISKSQFIREALQMKIDYIDDYQLATEHFTNAEKKVNKFKYTLNDQCTKNKELNIWLIPDDTKGRRCAFIRCENETCLSNAVMRNVLRPHLKDEQGKWKDIKIHDAFATKHRENMLLESYIEDEEYINIIETWLLDLMGRYNL